MIDLRTGIGSVGRQFGNTWRPETAGNITFDQKFIRKIIGRPKTSCNTRKSFTETTELLGHIRRIGRVRTSIQCWVISYAIINIGSL